MGLSQTEFGLLFEPPWDQGYVSRLEQGRISIPAPLRLRELAAALDVTPLYLMEVGGWAGAAMMLRGDRTPYDELSPSRQELLALIGQLPDQDVQTLLRVVRPMVATRTEQ
jgi:transcriptional regulator with XRE-family HTH domain